MTPTEEKHKILFDANIDESIWGLCTIDTDGTINTPNNHVLYENGLMDEEQYLLWKSMIQPPQPDKISICLERLDLQEESTLDIDYRLTLMELGI